MKCHLLRLTELMLQTQNIPEIELPASKIIEEIKNKVKQLSNRIGQEATIYIRRKTMWNDFLQHRQKPWNKKDENLHIILVGEPAISVQFQFSFIIFKFTTYNL